MKPVLVFRHTPDELLGTLAPALERQGLCHRMATLCDEGLPALAPRDWSALVVLGGPMNVDEVEAHPFLAEEPAWIAAAAKAGIPVLGICLGAQLLAKSQGARVVRSPVREIGFFPLHWLPAAHDDPLWSGQRDQRPVFQWHSDTFDLPPGAVHLAWGESCRNQAYRLGSRCWGLQFHLEVTTQIIENWLAESDAACAPGYLGEPPECDAATVARVRQESERLLGPMQQMAGQVFDRFCRLVVATSTGE